MPLDAGMSPQIRLKSVVLPAPFGPEHGTTLALGDVEVDVAHCEQPAETPADPPQAEGRRGVLDGWCCVGHYLT